MVRDITMWIEPQTHDYFGRVKSAELQVRGQLYEIGGLGTRLKRLKMGGHCSLDCPAQTDLREKTYYLPLAKLVDLNNASASFQGLLIQETGKSTETVLRRFRRVGIGFMSERRAGNEDCNILDDSSWASLLSISALGSDEGSQTISIV